MSELEAPADGPATTDLDVTGTAASVLEQVGDDPVLAREAFLAEQEGKNRSTLLARLDSIANAGQQSDPAPQPMTPGVPQYVALRRLRYEGQWIEKGEFVPGAHAWPRIESWVRQRYVKKTGP